MRLASILIRPLLSLQFWFVIAAFTLPTLSQALGGYGILPVMFSEQFPVQHRFSGSGIVYALSVNLGGSIPPVIASYLTALSDLLHGFTSV